MRYVAAYLLAALGGNDSVDVKAISSILSSVGIDCDDSLAKRVVDELAGKSIEDVIAEGSAKLASVPSGGAVAASGSGAAAAGGDAPAEEKKEEKKEESEEESDDDMGFGLFD